MFHAGGAWAICGGLFIMPPSGKARPNMWYFPISPMSIDSVGFQPNSVV